SRRRHTRFSRDWSSDVCSSDLADGVNYPIENVVGILPGVNPEGIMLVSHYDSRGHVGRTGEQGRSYGAMDDGYGVSTMLELAYRSEERRVGKESRLCKIAYRLN